MNSFAFARIDHFIVRYVFEQNIALFRLHSILFAGITASRGLTSS